MAMCVIAVVGVAPCQCLSPGENHTTSPGRISSIGPSHFWAHPSPEVTINVCPSGCVCQAVRAPGSKVTLAPRTRAGAGASNSGSIRTVPANQSADSPSSASGLANISTRADVLTGESATIGGFVIAGTENHTVLVRGLGPTLTSCGINGVLANPFLTLHYIDLLGHDTVVASNDNWKDSQRDAISPTGLAPSDDTEAAIIQSLAPGSYTAVLTDADGGSGVGLIEVYDLSAGGTSLLFNISTRGFVGVDDHVLAAELLLEEVGEARLDHHGEADRVAEIEDLLSTGVVCGSERKR